MKKVLLSLLITALVSLSVSARETLNFLLKPLAADKAALTENSFYLDKVLGVANFSPDLRLPVQLFYKSTSESTGMFGFGWSSRSWKVPQSRKRTVFFGRLRGTKRSGFYEKEKSTKEMLELYREGMKGRGDYYSPYAQWEANTGAAKSKRSQT